jgi:predicted phosphoribosyltransferase
MFIDRKDAAEKLGRALEKYRGANVIVLGIPRGGAETAYYVAKHLHAELALVITRKLGYPFNPETAFGAVAEDGSLYISDAARERLTEEQMHKELLQQKEEIKRRVKKFRQGKPLPELKGRTVIVTDDGIATGATLFAAIGLCKKNKASKIVVAAPISGKRMEAMLKKMVDDVVILETPEDFRAVSQGYKEFRNLSDEEAMAFISKGEKEHHI